MCGTAALVTVKMADRLKDTIEGACGDSGKLFEKPSGRVSNSILLGSIRRKGDLRSCFFLGRGGLGFPSCWKVRIAYRGCSGRWRMTHLGFRIFLTASFLMVLKNGGKIIFLTESS